MLWTTKSAPLRRGAYVAGRSMSADSQETWCAQGGGVEDEDTAFHFGSPERLEVVSWNAALGCGHEKD
jgi:hypothetical protein